jgi:hypothetical protein
MNRTVCAFSITLCVLAFGASVAEAGQGWYLLVPEVVQDGNNFRPSSTLTPLREWDQVGAFETAPQCEDARRARAAGARVILNSPAPKILEGEARRRGLLPPRPDEDEALSVAQREKAINLTVPALMADTWGRCIASDDPRLTQNAPPPPAQPPPAAPVQARPPTPAFKAAVGSCSSIVRAHTNNQYARLGITIVQSRFEAFVTPDGMVSFIGDQAERFSFEKCMNEMGHPLVPR